MLYQAIEASPSAELADPDVLTRYFAKFDEQFFHYCDSELTKINTFYSEKLAEATRKYASLRSELSEAQNEGIIKRKILAFQEESLEEEERRTEDSRDEACVLGILSQSRSPAKLSKPQFHWLSKDPQEAR